MTSPPATAARATYEEFVKRTALKVPEDQRAGYISEKPWHALDPDERKMWAEVDAEISDTDRRYRESQERLADQLEAVTAERDQALDAIDLIRSKLGRLRADLLREDLTVADVRRAVKAAERAGDSTGAGE